MDATAPTSPAAPRALRDFKIEGYTPFGGEPADVVRDLLRQANGLTGFLAEALSTAQSDGIPRTFVAEAVEATHTLIALTLFAAEELQ